MRTKVVRVRVAASADDVYREGASFNASAVNFAAGVIPGPTSVDSAARFDGVDVPRRAKILKAYLDLTGQGAAVVGSAPPTKLDAEDADDPAAISSDADWNGRVRTTASLDWDDAAPANDGPLLSPNIAHIIQEVVDRPGWQRDNAIIIFWEDDGGAATNYVLCVAYDDAAATAPLLHIEYEERAGAKAIATVHEDFPPYRALAELPTAGPIDRVHVLSGARGRFRFDIAADDANATADVVREGRVVVVRSTAGVEPYVGRIEYIGDDPAGRTVSIEGQNLAAILYEREIPSDSSFADHAAGAIAMQLLHLVNTTNPTGIWPSPASEPGLPIAGTIELGGTVLGRALDQLADMTGDEWWLEHTVQRNRLEVFLRWGRKRGDDKSASVHLQEGIHLAAAGYGRDALGHVRSVIAIGGGATIANRPAAVRTVDRPSAYPDRASVVERSSDEYARTVALSPSLAREIVEFMPLDTDEAVLADAAGRLLEQPVNAAESFDLTVNTALSWGVFGPGDIVRVILHSARLGDAVSRRVRVLAMQPDEADGEMDLVVQVEA